MAEGNSTPAPGLEASPLCKGPWVADLAAGTEFVGFYVTRNPCLVDFRDPGRGKYLRMQLLDRTGVIDARLWDGAEGLFDEVKEGGPVKVAGGVETFREELQVNVRRLRRALREELDMADFVSVTGTFSESHPELTPAASAARSALEDVWMAAEGRFFEQERACHPCSSACDIPCQQDTGACYLIPEAFGDPRDPGPCYELTEQICAARGGVSLPEERCPSACWFTNPEFADLPPGARCTMTDSFTCWEIPERANEQQRGGDGLNVTTRYCPYRTCGDPICDP
jgi:hypothetical protein